MNGMLIAKLAIFFYFELTGLVFLILGVRIIPPFALLAGQQYYITHNLFLCLKQNNAKNCVILQSSTL